MRPEPLGVNAIAFSEGKFVLLVSLVQISQTVVPVVPSQILRHSPGFRLEQRVARIGHASPGGKPQGIVGLGLSAECQSENDDSNVGDPEISCRGGFHLISFCSRRGGLGEQEESELLCAVTAFSYMQDNTASDRATALLRLIDAVEFLNLV